MAILKRPVTGISGEVCFKLHRQLSSDMRPPVMVNIFLRENQMEEKKEESKHIFFNGKKAVPADGSSHLDDIPALPEDLTPIIPIETINGAPKDLPEPLVCWFPMPEKVRGENDSPEEISSTPRM